MATTVPAARPEEAGYHSKPTGIVPALGSARSNGTRRRPHHAPGRSLQGRSFTRPTVSSVGAAAATAGPSGPAASAAASSAATVAI